MRDCRARRFETQPRIGRTASCGCRRWPRRVVATTGAGDTCGGRVPGRARRAVAGSWSVGIALGRGGRGCADLGPADRRRVRNGGRPAELHRKGSPPGWSPRRRIGFITDLATAGSRSLRPPPIEARDPAAAGSAPARWPARPGRYHPRHDHPEIPSRPILVLYQTTTGNTKLMADLVAEGAACVRRHGGPASERRRRHARRPGVVRRHRGRLADVHGHHLVADEAVLGRDGQAAVAQDRRQDRMRLLVVGRPGRRRRDDVPGPAHRAHELRACSPLVCPDYVARAGRSTTAPFAPGGLATKPIARLAAASAPGWRSGFSR